MCLSLVTVSPCPPIPNTRMSLQIFRLVQHFLTVLSSADASLFASWIWSRLCANTATLSDWSSCYGWAECHNKRRPPSPLFSIHYMVPTGHLLWALAVNTLHYKIFYFQAAKMHPNQFLFALWSSMPELVCCTKAVRFYRGTAGPWEMKMTVLQRRQHNVPVIISRVCVCAPAVTQLCPCTIFV